MQLRAQLYLSDAGNSARNGRRIRAGWLQPTWVLPRAWCVTASLQAKGVPRHKTAAFAQLHLNRLAPFADSGVFACRAGDWVHFWFWENQRVRDLCQQHGLDMASLRLVPESVCFPRLAEGAVLYRGAEGVEAQLWHNGRLVDSAWWPQAPDLATWQAWRPTAAASMAAQAMPVAWPESAPHLGGGLGPQASTELRQPWATNLFGEKWTGGLRQLRPATFIVLCAGLGAAMAAYWGTQWLTLHQMQANVDRQIADLSTRVEPINTARSEALHLLQWTTRMAALNNRDSINEILKALQPVLQKQDGALREFEYTDGEIRLMVVPLTGDLDIAQAVQQLEALPLLAELRLLPESDARVLRVSAKIRRGASVAPMAPASAAPSTAATAPATSAARTREGQ